ncbi:amidophosphoribosyltransferase [Mycobacterium sp.]|jgi:hypothetical protein|uniref:ComF family protein n=1 Tax=Mycobacterium sp. TaxID=1785 RepID=UPI002D5F633E|nr:amidophosphoribosyltransferase [Mycobacterium sp.]HZA08436.1 amidophosphoribosyltransferase [Mycobacterium sp.]
MLIDDIAEARAALVKAAGGFLRNPVREPHLTCRVCAAPVGGFEYCWRCHEHQRIAAVAELVVPLTYAIGSTESAALLRDYKHHPTRKVREQHGLIINWLMFLAIASHERCFGAAVGLPVSLRLVIPSLTSRRGVHPLLEIARTMNAVGDTVALMPTGGCDRVVNADKFALASHIRLDGQHVMVLDDVWTTGSNAQSAALTLRRAGAAAVSVMVVGRWLSPHFGGTADFIETRLRRDYDAGICPVTGGQCP